MKNKTVCIIQTRMGSTRFPGKVMQPLIKGSTPATDINAMEFIHNACIASGVIDEIVLACPADDYKTFKIYAETQSRLTGKQFYVFGGSENNVYERTLQAAKYRQADIIVDITSDCPFVAPYEIKRMMERFKNELDTGWHYMSNVFPHRHVPDGQDIQIYTTEMMSYFSNKIEHQEHSGANLFMLAHPADIIKYEKMFIEQNCMGKYRITLDTPEDLIVLRELAKPFMEIKCTTFSETMLFWDHLKNRPESFWVNSEIKAKEIGEG